jgi:NADH-quinone oxidoreductase subunit N
MISIPVSTYGYLLPEIIVVLTGAFVLVADLIWPAGSGHYRGKVRTWPAYVGIAGLLLAGAAVLNQAGVTQTLFNGIIVVDPLSTFFKLLFIGIGVLVLLMSVEAMAKVSPWTAEFVALVVWAILGSMLLASAAELFTIFLSLQLTSLPLIVLVGYAKRDPRSGEAALKYLLLVLVSTAVLLYGMSLIYGSLGTSTLSEIGLRLGAEARVEPVVALGLVLLLTGFAFKITAAPFHYWVPDAYEGAPTPVTAFMSVGSKFAGFALALRVIVTAEHVPLDWKLIFGLMAAISMTLGNLGAIRQTSIKRMLAYSGIAQAGYLLVGVAAATTTEGMASVLFFALAYTLANLAAFAVVIIVANATGSVEIEDYAGLAKRAPLIALTMAIALLSLGGLPLMAGFMAKFYIFLNAARSGLAWLVAIAVANSVISLYYYLRVVWVMYVAEGATERLSIDRRAAAAMTFCVAGVLALGIYPEPAMRAAMYAAAALFGR